MIYCILLGRIYSCLKGKGFKAPCEGDPPHPPPAGAHTKDSHSTGITLLFSNSAWVLLHPTALWTFKELWDRTSHLSSLFEETRKSNHLQMKLQRLHFLLSYLKTLSVGLVGVLNPWPLASQSGSQSSEPPMPCLTNCRANCINAHEHPNETPLYQSFEILFPVIQI